MPSWTVKLLCAEDGVVPREGGCMSGSVDKTGAAEGDSSVETTVAHMRFPGERVFEVDVPVTASSDPSAYVFGVKKGGSTLLARILRDLGEYTEKPILELAKLLFRAGGSHHRVIEDIDGVLARPGYIFGVFRWLPSHDILPTGGKGPRIWLIRDPRDIMVSLYYSDRFSHALPKAEHARQNMMKKRERLAEIGVDEYVLEKAPEMMRHYMRSCQLLAHPNFHLFRYEDIIFDKAPFVRQLADLIGADVDDKVCAEIAKAHDIRPDKEREKSHVRQVTPGNFKEKLSGETIEKLDELFEPVLHTFNYK